MGNVGNIGNIGTRPFPFMVFCGGCGGGGPPAALVGAWRSAFVDRTVGPGVVELVLTNHGQFQQQTQYKAGALVTIFGTFRVFPGEALSKGDMVCKLQMSA